MNFFRRLAVLFYVTLGLFVGCFFLLAFFNLLDVRSVLNIFYIIYSDESLKLIAGILAVVFLFINFVFYRIFSEGRRREGIIAFDNPDGRVSVALSALEDLIKRVVTRLSEVKEVKSGIAVSRKGLKIKMKLIITSEVSIPEVTSRVQNLIKQKIQDAIGMDEDVEVEIYVGKILSEHPQEKIKKEKLVVEDGQESGIPFQGYRA